MPGLLQGTKIKFKFWQKALDICFKIGYYKQADLWFACQPPPPDQCGRENCMEKSRSWSSAHDWKSCRGQKLLESSNLSISATASKQSPLCFDAFLYLRLKIRLASLPCFSFPRRIPRMCLGGLFKLRIACDDVFLFRQAPNRAGREKAGADLCLSRPLSCRHWRRVFSLSAELLGLLRLK